MSNFPRALMPGGGTMGTPELPTGQGAELSDSLRKLDDTVDKLAEAVEEMTKGARHGGGSGGGGGSGHSVVSRPNAAQPIAHVDQNVHEGHQKSETDKAKQEMTKQILLTLGREIGSAFMAAL
ncbi:MAG: hypothetical protein KGL39_29720 [Patescibacteria group bacterium]|nr:hypothetical protein [Patescibacteria group bacterium]